MNVALAAALVLGLAGAFLFIGTFVVWGKNNKNYEEELLRAEEKPKKKAKKKPLHTEKAIAATPEPLTQSNSASAAGPKRRKRAKPKRAEPDADDTAPLMTNTAEQLVEDDGGWETLPKKEAKKAVNKNRTKFSLEIEEADGSRSNVLAGLSLHANAITETEASDLVEWCSEQYTCGINGQLKGSTFLQAKSQRKADLGMRKNGRKVLQYGVYYDYAGHRIAPEVSVEAMPPCLCKLVEKLEERSVLPLDKRMDSCIINHYGVGDCIPPHIDHMVSDAANQAHIPYWYVAYAVVF
jgi:alkylated DNA repair dioxygenase AlkB